MTRDQAIRVLFRFASRAAHPDHGGSSEDFVRVQQAAEVLKLPQLQGARWQTRREPWQCDMVLPFGKHKGKRLGSLPASYLSWMAMSMHDAGWRDCARAVLAWRAKR
jgi:curved DNA-binding protein CbpA